MLVIWDLVDDCVLCLGNNCMNLWHDLELGEKAPEQFNVIIEIPKGSKNKYEIDKKTGLIKLDRAMKTSQDYPFDYGFAPQTLWEDGDALDVIVLSTYPLATNILVEVRPVAVMHMIDGGEGDDKIIAVPVKDPRWEDTKDMADLNKHMLKEFKHFFETYKSIEDKKVEITGIEGKEAALEAVRKSVELYREKFSE
ncbi:MAG: inorganic pyrophosphatase [Patescibacteria group bacterium]|nr:inorganic pyrophosphatase [Patescibacteria group bacterium]